MPPETRRQAKIRAVDVLDSVGWPGDEPDDGSDPQVFDARDMRAEISDALHALSSSTPPSEHSTGPERTARETSRIFPYPMDLENSRKYRSARRMYVYGLSRLMEADIVDVEVSAADNLKTNAYVGYRAPKRPAVKAANVRIPMGEGCVILYILSIDA